MTRPARSPAPGDRYLIVRGPNVVLRLALPAFGSLTVGRGPGCDVPIPRSDLPEVAAEVFCDFDIGVAVHAGPAERVAGGDGAAAPVRRGETIDLAPGDRVRLAGLELAFAPVGEAPREHHVWSRAYLETRLQELLWAGDAPAVSLIRVRARGAGREATEAALHDALGESDVLGELGPDEHAVLVPGPEARGRAVARELTRALQGVSEDIQLGLVHAGEDDDPAHLLEQASLRMSDPSGRAAGHVYVPRAPAMEPVTRLVEQVSRTTAPVLVLGETGTGKDVLAQLVHERSDRATGPFVRVNCIDLPDTFLEEAETNFLARASGGTVLLDQVGGLTPRAQVSLGYLLEEAAETEHDVRFVATSNQDLARAVEDGSFRKDLYFRLNRVTISVPPLRERREDIVPLAEHFAREAARQGSAGAVPELTRPAQGVLEGYAWPGNLRELRNMMERAVLTAPEGRIGIEVLPAELSGGAAPPAPAVAAEEAPRPTNLRDEIAALERRRILEALEAYPTQTEAAKALGIPLRTFLNRLDALGIPRARKKD